MLAAEGMRFPGDVMWVCLRWYAAYPLSYHHLEEMMDERDDPQRSVTAARLYRAVFCRPVLRIGRTNLSRL